MLKLLPQVLNLLKSFSTVITKDFLNQVFFYLIVIILLYPFFFLIFSKQDGVKSVHCDPLKKS